VILLEEKHFYSSIWEVYGLKSDPFNTSPLLVFGGEIPLNTFMGRTQELKRLNNLLRNKGGSRVIVSGDVGVGKTTFVNFARAHAQEKGNFFTTIKEIAIQPDWDATDFIINTLGAILTTIERRKDVQIGDGLKKKLESLIAITEISNLSISASIAGFGGGGGKNVTRNPPIKLTMPMLQDLFEDIILELNKIGYKEIILHYNNLELFEQSDLIQLFNKIRDFSQTKNVHFIFVGGLIVPATIQPISRVSSIFSDTPIILPNLGLNEVESIINKRIEALTIKGFTSDVPIDKEVIKILYDLYEGNLRHILNSLSTAFKEVTDEIPVRLTVTKLKESLFNLVKERWLNKITDVEKGVLFEILNVQEITNKQLSSKLKKHPQNISKITNKLLDLCAIRVKRKEGREKFFSVEPSLKWFLLEKIEEKEDKKEKDIQKFMKDFLKPKSPE